MPRPSLITARDIRDTAIFTAAVVVVQVILRPDVLTIVVLAAASIAVGLILAVVRNRRDAAPGAAEQPGPSAGAPDSGAPPRPYDGSL
ncbi:MAG: hypothetical protein ABW040_02385 [Microbacteriaceae bacterium]